MFREGFFGNNLVLLSIFFGSILCNGVRDDRIFFDGEVDLGRFNRDQNGRTMSLERQIQLAQELNEITSFEDFVRHLHGVPSDENLLGNITSRFAGETRANFEIPKPASCGPQLQAVSLTNDSASSTVFYYPRCTHVPRCGACCGHPSLSCQPTATVTRNFQLVVAEYNIDNGKTFKRKEIVPIEEHTKCECSCKIKAHHCNQRQIYSKEKCRCDCANVDDEVKCLRSNDTKMWDEDKCICQCRGSRECTTGSYFDETTCSCKKIAVGTNRRRQTGNGGSPISPNSGRIPAIRTINANDPRRRHREDPE